MLTPSKLVKNRAWQFVKVAIACFIFLSILAWLIRILPIQIWLKSLSVEAVLSLLGGAFSLVFSTFTERLKQRNIELAKELKENRKVAEENYSEFINSLRVLEGRIDEQRLAMNAFEGFADKDVKHDQDVVAIRSDIAELSVKFADLAQRQQQGDRLARFADTIALCLVQQERILGKLPLTVSDRNLELDE